MKNPHNRHIWQAIAVFAADLAVFGLVNAHNAPVYMLFIGFLLLMASIYYLVRLCARLLGLYGIKISHSKRFVLSATGLLSLIVALKSIGQVGPRDILVLSVVAGLMYLYLSLARKPRSARVESTSLNS